MCWQSVCWLNERGRPSLYDTPRVSGENSLGLFLAKGNDNSIGRPSASDYLERSFAKSTATNYSAKETSQQKTVKQQGFGDFCGKIRRQSATVGEFYLPGLSKLPTMNMWERLQLQPRFPPLFAEKGVKTCAYHPVGQTMIERGNKRGGCQTAGTEMGFDLSLSAPN